MRDMRRLMFGMGWPAMCLAIASGSAAAKSLDTAGCAFAPASADHPVLRGRALFEDANRPSQRLVAIKLDAQHASRWAVTVDCAHPDWPARMVLLSHTPGKGETTLASIGPLAPVQRTLPASFSVRAGATVRLWKHDGVTSLETTGIAEEGGEIGKRMRVRLLRQGMNSQESASYVSGVVRGAGDVEIVP